MNEGNYKDSFSVYDDLEKVVGEELQKTALHLDGLLISRTPRDTGQAKANWIVTIGSPTDKQITKEFSESAARQQGETEIKKAKAGDTIFIQNNLPYIVRLNDGWSQQAPKKFIEQCINKAVKRRGS